MVVKKTIWRVCFYLLGQFILSYGIAFAVAAGLGVSPITSVSFAISTVSGVSLGTIVTLVYCGCMVVQMLLLRRQYKPIYLLGLPFSIIAGRFVDFAKWSIAAFQPQAYPVRLLALILSILLIGLGLAVYLASDIIPMPAEGMGLAVTGVVQKRFPKVTYAGIKVLQDCVFVLLAVLILLVGQGRIEGIREGTLVTALLAGRSMGLFAKLVRRPIRRLCFGAQPEQEKTAAAN